MFEIKLKNNKVFNCDSDTTILSAASNAGYVLEHSCLNARCRSCRVKILEGNVVNIHEQSVLTDEERSNGFVLSCNVKPISNLKLDVEDLGNIKMFSPKVVPAKIDNLEKLNNDVIKLTLRFPPSVKFEFLPGQYVNFIKGNIKRSYSIANRNREDNKLEFFIKNYQNGVMSSYLFNEAKKNDLLRIQGPLGTFFYRNKDSIKDIVFLATGTGIAPVKSILEYISHNQNEFQDKKIWLFFGGRFKDDIFYIPELNLNKFSIIPVLSRQTINWDGETGYVQDALIKQRINLNKAVVYACGSKEMIISAKRLLIKNSLDESNFYSDAFVSSN